MKKKAKARILRITQLGEAILRQRLKDVDAKTLGSAGFQRFVDDMIATMKKAQGVGIAANQVNDGRRVFIVAPEPSERYPKSPTMPPLAMINPKLVKASKQLVSDWEGCLSIPGIRAIVPRHRSLEIEFTTREGDVVRAKLAGFVARIFQHEFDHINGFCYLDRVKDTKTFMTEQSYRVMMTQGR